MYTMKTIGVHYLYQANSMNRGKNTDIGCRRCGNCCHVDVTAYVTIEDVQRWEREGRQDILDHVRSNNVTWTSGGIINKFGSNIRTCLMSCVYLKWYGPIASCEIYETRTKVCRSYVPGSSNLCPQYNEVRQVGKEINRVTD